MNTLEPNRTKIAKRVFEILEFFSEDQQSLTVMDIVRRYGRPQSSTSELLSSMVEMGLLYKDQRSRSYTPTPRIAALGTSAQPEIIRDGGLFGLMDQLAATTGRSVGLFGAVGTHVQIFRLAAGSDAVSKKINHGAAEQLSFSVVGLLLLSRFPPDLAERMLWRMHAEAEPGRKFDLKELKNDLCKYRRERFAAGDAGFGGDVQVAAALLPGFNSRRPLALGVLYPLADQVDPDLLVGTINDGIAKCTKKELPKFYSEAPPPLRIVARA